MPIRLKDYGRNHKKRKEYIHQSRLLLAGVGVCEAKHDACIGTLEGIRCWNVWFSVNPSALKFPRLTIPVFIFAFHDFDFFQNAALLPE